MITLEYLMDNRDNIENLSDNLSKEDISFLVNLLNEKNNDIRYTAFLVLQKRSEKSDDLYSYWEVLAKKLYDSNSYQRSIGIMLLAENVRWDQNNSIEKIIKSYLTHCEDEKFITSRQTIQSISKWIELKPELIPVITEKLISIKIDLFKDTQQKLILTDILNVMLQINRIKPSQQITQFIMNALTGGLLDKKTIKQIESQL